MSLRLNVGLASSVVTVSPSPSGDTSGATDLAKLQAWINASAVGSVLNFAPGTFLVNGTLKLLPQRTYVGAHHHDSVIKQANGANMTTPIVASNGYMTGATVTDNPVNVFRLAIDGNKANNTSTAIGLAVMSWASVFQNVYVYSAPSHGIMQSDANVSGGLLTNSQVENRYMDCRAYSSGGHGFWVTDLSSVHSNTDGFLIDGIYAGSGLDGVRIERGAGWIIDGQHIYTVQQNGVLVQNCWGTRICNQYVEAGFGLGSGGSFSTFPCGVGADVISGSMAGVIMYGNFVGMASDPANGNTFQYLRVQGSGNPSYALVYGNIVRSPTTGAAHIGLRTQNAGGALTAEEFGNLIIGFGSGKDYSLAATVTQSFRSSDVQAARHFTATTTAPTIAAQAANGTSPPAPTLGSNSHDASGQANFGTGTTPASGGQVTVTFASAYASVPNVTISPANSASAAANAYVTVGTTGLTINFPSAPTGGQAAGTYSFYYTVIG